MKLLKHFKQFIQAFCYYLLVAIVVNCILYLCAAFAFFDFNPKNFTPGSRSFAGVINAAIFLFLMLFMFLNKEDLFD